LARVKWRKPTDRPADGRWSSESGDAEHYSRSFRVGFGAVIFAVVGLNLAVGVAVWVGEHRIVEYASSIYDDAFTAAAHIQKSELSFERFVAARAIPTNRWGDDAADDRLATSADELELAIEHTQAEQTRALEEAVRVDIGWLRRQSSDDPSVHARLADAEAGLDRLASAGDSKARQEIQDFSSRGDRLLLALAAARVLVAATFLIILFRLMRRMSRLANYDSLTGLLKRPLLHARLREALLRLRGDNRGFALLSLDLDRFKRVNDTLGHQTGDLLLREVAKRISGQVRPGDIVARFGGDEFVILQASLRAPGDAGELAGRLVTALGAPYEINGQRILIGASVGIALAPENGRNAEELLRDSDIALYRAKAGGKGRFLYFAAEMDAVMQSKRLLEIDLREALDKRQLEVHFQPIVDISTGRIVACEALVRWNHRGRGFIPPSDFLPLAEETGLIVPLGDFVLRKACAEAANWNREIRVAVNLSVLQVGSNDLISSVVKALAETGLPASRLDLEITETLLLGNKDEVLKTLTSLRDLGARISLDDFGTGYSSLAYLSSFPFDKIKIDHSFVRDVTNRADSAAIVRAVIGLAGALGITTTAEGVETAEELDWLRAHGCQEGQGFLFSKPIPSRDLELLLGMTAGQKSDFSAANKQAA
jgi:diguanylate cyclase (GGDEF)-like protein